MYIVAASVVLCVVGFLMSRWFRLDDPEKKVQENYRNRIMMRYK